MDNGHHLRLNARERSYLAILKKDLHAIAVSAGFSTAKTADIDIVVSELCSNLVKHAKEGEVLVRVSEESMELIAIDSGPGMDVSKMSEDGMSTTNTLGQGLGAIRRLSDFCDIYSIVGWGTIVICRFYKTEQPHYKKPVAVDVRCLVVAKPGETACGDGVSVIYKGKLIKILIGDGLGHGPEAQAAVTAAERAFVTSEEESPVELLRAIHPAVKRTRGLVATVAIFDMANKAWNICGIGNIYTWLGNQQGSKGVMSYNGIVGVNIPGSLNTHVVIPEHGHVLVMCSDGIKPKWDLQKYPLILRHDLTVLAAALYKDFARRTDDMSILIARINRKP
jgi:anti-sigma regulatory factor (Ser/Thr protein kinase)